MAGRTKHTILLSVAIFAIACAPGERGQGNTANFTSPTPTSTPVPEVVKGVETPSPVSQASTNPPRPTSASQGGPDRYLGCWSGMRGGRLRITPEKIEDLNTGEASRYLARPVAATDAANGMETGETYILQTGADFPKSFLGRVIEISYLSDGTAGFAIYDSYQGYLKEAYVRMGLFGRVPCDVLIRSKQWR